MAKYKNEDFAGKRFGKWTGVELAGKQKKVGWMVTCKCECGNERAIGARALVTGRYPECSKCRVCTGDRTGQVFGLLKVISPNYNATKNGRKYRVCDVECLACGTTKSVQLSHLCAGTCISCGCQKNKLVGDAKREHGHCVDNHSSPEYLAWLAIKARCQNPNTSHYHNYGGRGINMCEEWDNDFEAFFKYLGPRPSPFHSVDKIDNDKWYGPGNARWATQKEQCNNRRNNRIIEWDGERKTLTQWAEVVGIHPNALSSRLARGWPLDKALTVRKLLPHERLPK